MKIKTVEIVNFKCLGSEGIRINFDEDIVVLIGENNVGKSAVLESLSYFFSGTKTIPTDLFYNGMLDEEHAIQITASFHSLTQQDKEHQAISPYIQVVDGVEMWTLRKRYYYAEEGKSECDYFTLKPDGDWKKDPGGFKQNVDDLFTNEKMQTAFVEAVKDVAEESSPGAKSAFGKIFNMLVRGDVESSDKFKDLETAIEEYKTLFGGSTKLDSINRLESQLNAKLQRVISVVSKINLEVPPFKDKIMPDPVLLTNDQREIDVGPQNQGNGLQRALIFCLLEMLAEQSSPIDKEVGPRNLIMIEEPEIYMHPQMERKISDTLYKIAEDGFAQVVCTTHSPVFINMANKHEALVRLTRGEDNNINCKQVGEMFIGSDKDDKKKKLQMITNFDPTVNEIFFAKRVVLIEGDTEVAIFREAAELLNYFGTEVNKHKKRDTTFVNCRGKWTIPLFQEVMNHFGINYVVIHDKDNENLDEGANGAILGFLNSDETKRMYFDPKIETVLGITDTGKEKPIKALDQIHQLNNENNLESKLGVFIKFAYDIS